MGSHDQGYSGEQSMGFFFGERGYFFVEGPSGAAGHGITSQGFDGVAYNPRIRHLVLYDNKAFARSGNVSSATAIDPARNLNQNLNRLIMRVNGMTDLPCKGEILDLLRRTRNSIQTGSDWPHNVQIAVSNAGGRSTGVSRQLVRRGIQFINFNKTLRPPRFSQRQYMDIAALLGSLLGSIAEWIGDIGIERQIQSRLKNELSSHIWMILLRGEGVLVIIQMLEWDIPDFQGRRARRLFDVYVQGGQTQQTARQAWEQPARMFPGPPMGWHVTTQYGWIPPLTLGPN